jgi:hypothetical protein
MAAGGQAGMFELVRVDQRAGVVQVRTVHQSLASSFSETALKRPGKGTVAERPR